MYVRARKVVFLNGVRIKNVTSITCENNSRNIGASCEITLPLNARIKSEALLEQEKIFFNAGDKIDVYVKYDGNEADKYAVPLMDAVTDEQLKDKYLKIFTGFVHSFTLGTPFKVKCIDYLYWANLTYVGNSKIDIYKKRKQKNGTYEYETDKDGNKIIELSGIGVSWEKVKFVEVLEKIVEWINIQIAEYNSIIKAQGGDYLLFGVEIMGLDNSPEIFDMTLENLSFIRMTPAAILEHFRKELGLVVTFIDNKLYVNVANFIAGTVKLKTNINVITSNLQTNNITDRRKRTSKGALSVFNRIKVKCNFLNELGVNKTFEVGDPMGETREVFYYNIKPTSLDSNGIPKNYLERANNALDKFTQEAYGGEIETLIYPYFDLFWRVRYRDIRYPERNGQYICISVKYDISENGYKRTALLSYLENEEEQW